MKKLQNKDTRYYIDIDMASHKIVTWNYDQRQTLIQEQLPSTNYVRIYITKGQYAKLEKSR
ncbi:MAG: hypothetical protein JXQ69_03890 [Paludibacteraceae bacterium]|nr:hypothetical protein [Paludibacteraceae bacterium]MBN2787447.1 hypothetical protein [Paludibacteraceae bacterium]